MSKISDSSLSTQQLELASTMEQESPLQLSLSQEVLGQTCTKCGIWKPLDQYGFQSHRQIKRNGERKLHKLCRECHNRTRKEGKLAFLNVFKHTKDSKLGKEVYRERIGTPCDCCGKIMEIPHFDHCHKTIIFRGWLCTNCNVGIGKLGDNLEGLLKAVDYLKRAYETTD